MDMNINTETSTEYRYINIYKYGYKNICRYILFILDLSDDHDDNKC